MSLVETEGSKIGALIVDDLSKYPQADKLPILSYAYEYARREIQNQVPPTVVLFEDKFTDTFTYNKDGALSQNKKWKLHYKARGLAEQRNSMCIIRPEVAPGTDTRAVKILSEKQLSGNVEYIVTMKTTKQTKPTTPNRWEMGWIFFNYVDRWHHYYFYLKKGGGYEVGRKDNDTQKERQIFIATNSKTPTDSTTFNKENTIRIKTKQVSANGLWIRVWVNDSLLVDVIDNGTIGSDGSNGPRPRPPSTSMVKGPFTYGMYVEDAEAQYANFKVVQ